MNLFDLPGPRFLLVYFVLAVAVIAVAAVLRRALESGPIPRFGDVDPYLVAYLRGGENEAIRVAVISLLDRGLIRADGDTLIAGPSAVERARRPLERAILEAFLVQDKAYSVFSREGPREACKALANKLKERQLLPGGSHVLARAVLWFGALLLLWWIAYTKIQLALSRGHSNILFLVMLAAPMPFVLAFVMRSRRTPIGDRVLEDFKTLFSRLRDRAEQIQPGGATNELALLAGVYGLGALAGPALSQAQALFPMGSQLQVSNSTWGSSCGNACGSQSACGSVSSSSCGSSCGGGGCGGGCGGCGG